MSNKDIGLCMIHNFFIQEIDKAYQTYLNISNKELQEIKKKWTKVRLELLNKTKTRKCLAILKAQARLFLTPGDKEDNENHNETDNNTNNIDEDKIKITETEEEENTISLLQYPKVYYETENSLDEDDSNKENNIGKSTTLSRSCKSSSPKDVTEKACNKTQ